MPKFNVPCETLRISVESVQQNLSDWSGTMSVRAEYADTTTREIEFEGHETRRLRDHQLRNSNINPSLLRSGDSFQSPGGAPHDGPAGMGLLMWSSSWKVGPPNRKLRMLLLFVSECDRFAPGLASLGRLESWQHMTQHETQLQLASKWPPAEKCGCAFSRSGPVSPC